MRTVVQVRIESTALGYIYASRKIHPFLLPEGIIARERLGS